MFLIDNFMQSLMVRIVYNIDDIEAACLLHFYLCEITPSTEHPRNRLTEILMAIRANVRDHAAVYALRNHLLELSMGYPSFEPPLRTSTTTNGVFSSASTGGNPTQYPPENVYESPSSSDVVYHHSQDLGSFPTYIFSDAEENVQINPAHHPQQSNTVVYNTLFQPQHELTIQRPSFDGEYTARIPFDRVDGASQQLTPLRAVENTLINEMVHREPYPIASSSSSWLSTQSQASTSTSTNAMGPVSPNENEIRDAGAPSRNKKVPLLNIPSNTMVQLEQSLPSGAASLFEPRYIKCMWDNGSCGQKIKSNSGNIEFMKHFTTVHGANYAVLTKKGVLSEKDTSKGYDICRWEGCTSKRMVRGKAVRQHILRGKGHILVEL
ncbi:hypothetical protein BDN70DRAFT_935586 [Pholiota conissans]|uniref:Uncharacterized protein n=1 Tax=Pholiota conissans TaxID=109636 RepID=A0A9P5YTZ7_9AGAR|nr:hypothetical protein BDN70DRAFT_935586 [Pholiota conissans]